LASKLLPTFPGCGKDDCDFSLGREVVVVPPENLMRMFRQLEVLVAAVNASGAYEENSLAYFVRKSLEKWFTHAKDGELWVFYNYLRKISDPTKPEEYYIVYREHGYLEAYLIKGDLNGNA
jgi:hypothetical protein